MRQPIEMSAREPASVDGLEQGELARLYTRHAPAVFARARRLLGDETQAWDVTHDVFVRLAARRKPPRAPVRYLYRAVTNACIDRWRRADGRWAVPLDEAPGTRDPRQAALARSVLRALWADLDETDRRIAVLRFVDGLPQREIASILGIWRRTVGRRLDRIIARARALAEEPS